MPHQPELLQVPKRKKPRHKNKTLIRMGAHQRRILLRIAQQGPIWQNHENFHPIKRLLDRGYVQRLKYETRITIRITERGLRALAIRTKKP